MGYGSHDAQALNSYYLEKYRDIGFGKVNTPKPFVFFEDFDRPIGIFAVSGGGFGGSNGTQANLTGAPSVYELDTTATSTRTSIYNPAVPICNNPLTKKFYMAGRFKIPTVPDAQAVNFIGMMDDGSDTLGLGAIGAESTDNFVFQYNGALGAGTMASLGLTLDTEWHIFQMWGEGNGYVNCILDGESSTAPGTLVRVLQTTAMAHGELNLYVANGSTSASQKLDTDWVLMVSER